MATLETGGDPEPAVRQRSARRLWALAFAAFFLLIGGWSVAAPLAGPPDEGDHMLRAYAAADGQIFPELVTTKNGTGGRFTVPRGLVPDYCWQFRPLVSAACSGDPRSDRTMVEQDVIVGRYPPLYYAVVGLPLRLSPDWTGLLLARLISAAMCAALLATALTDALRWSRHRWMAVGVVAAVTPMAAHMAGAINPNGLEIAAGVALAAAAVPLLQLPEAERSRRLLRHVGIAAVTMSAIRVLGPLWVAIVILALMLPLTRARLLGWWRWPAARRWFVVVVAVMAASATWTLTFHANNIGDYTHGKVYGKVQAVRLTMLHTRYWSDQMVGIMSWLDAVMPPFVYPLWQAGVAALLVWGFALADRRGRLTLLALGAGALGVPFVMQVLYINKTGLVTAGRYLLPMAVGLPILAALLLQRSGLAARASRSVGRLVVLVLLPLHVVCLSFTMVRWQRGEGFELGGGLAYINPLDGFWHPPLGSLLPLVLTTAGVILLGWLVLGPFVERVTWPPAEGRAGDERVKDLHAAPGDEPGSTGPDERVPTSRPAEAPDGAVSAA
jgi:hypothetical protein